MTLWCQKGEKIQQRSIVSFQVSTFKSAFIPRQVHIFWFYMNCFPKINCQKVWKCTVKCTGCLVWQTGSHSLDPTAVLPVHIPSSRGMRCLPEPIQSAHWTWKGMKTTRADRQQHVATAGLHLGKQLLPPFCYKLRKMHAVGILNANPIPRGMGSLSLSVSSHPLMLIICIFFNFFLSFGTRLDCHLCKTSVR